MIGDLIRAGIGSRLAGRNQGMKGALIGAAAPCGRTRTTPRHLRRQVAGLPCQPILQEQHDARLRDGVEIEDALGGAEQPAPGDEGHAARPGIARRVT